MTNGLALFAHWSAVRHKLNRVCSVQLRRSVRVFRDRRAALFCGLASDERNETSDPSSSLHCACL